MSQKKPPKFDDDLTELSKDKFSDLLPDISEEEITNLLESMVRKGYLTSFIKDGETYYELTENGRLARAHMDSDPKLRN